MNTFIRVTSIFLILSALSTGLKAQEGLHIGTIFQKYGKQKGVTMVELNKSMLESYQITLYKSLVFKEVTDYLPEILKTLEQDKKGGSVKKMQEVTEDGNIISAYYQLTSVKRGKDQIKRYILFKTGNKEKATLVYIEGLLDSDDLVTLLFMKN